MHGGDVDVEVLVRVDVEERLLTRHRIRRERRVRLVREGLRRCVLHAGEDLVPDGVAQPSMLLFLTRYCCCEPLTMPPPVNSESATKPPLAKDGPVQ